MKFIMLIQTKFYKIICYIKFLHIFKEYYAGFFIFLSLDVYLISYILFFINLHRDKLINFG